MTRPAPASTRILLVRDSRRADVPAPASAIVKRYRLARLRFDDRDAGADCRYEHLKRVFD